MPLIDKRSLIATLAKLIFDNEVAASTADMIGRWSDADRKNLLQIADEEDLLNVAIARLQTDTGRYPTAFVDDLAKRAQQRRQWSALRINLLHELLGGMADASIAVRTIKGFALGQDLYGSALARDSHDIDLIVAPADAHAAALWLSQRGYLPEFDARWFADRRLLNSLREATFRSLGGVLEVDLHWRIDHPWSPQITPVARLLADQSCTVLVEGKQIAWFSALNVALIQASNIVNSWDTELRSVIDFARSITRLQDHEAAELVGHFRSATSLWVLATLTRVACRVCGIDRSALPAPLAELATADGSQPEATERAMIDEALGVATPGTASRRRSHSNRRFVRTFAQHMHLIGGHLRPGLADFVALPPAATTTSLTLASMRRRVAVLANLPG